MDEESIGLVNLFATLSVLLCLKRLQRRVKNVLETRVLDVVIQLEQNIVHQLFLSQLGIVQVVCNMDDEQMGEPVDGHLTNG